MHTKHDKKNNANIKIIPTNKSIEHYGDPLTENSDKYLIGTPTEILIESKTITVDITILRNAMRQLKNGRASG